LFTGLVAEMGDVVSLMKKGSGARLSLEAVEISRNAKLGDSIAINGTCLTVVEIKGRTLAFDLSDETLRSSNLGELKARDRVNLEPALRPDDRLGGHFVTGHIDGTGVIRSKTREGEVFKIVIRTESWIAEYLVEKVLLPWTASALRLLMY